MISLPMIFLVKVRRNQCLSTAHCHTSVTASSNDMNIAESCKRSFNRKMILERWVSLYDCGFLCIHWLLLSQKVLSGDCRDDCLADDDRQDDDQSIRPAQAMSSLLGEEPDRLDIIHSRCLQNPEKIQLSTQVAFSYTEVFIIPPIFSSGQLSQPAVIQ